MICRDVAYVGRARDSYIRRNQFNSDHHDQFKERYDINEFMINRPSRIYYHFKYNKLDEDSIIDFCKDKGVKKSVTTDIIEVSRRASQFSFDMLQTIVEEHLRYNENIETVCVDLNINVESEDFQLEITHIENMSTHEVFVPIERNTTIPLSMLSRDGCYVYYKSKNSTGINKNTNECDDIEDEMPYIYLTKKYVVYETTDIKIFENDGMRVITKVTLPTKFQNYKEYLF